MTDNNTVPVPVPIRVGAYLTGTAVGLLGDPGIAYLTAEHHIDTATGVFLGAVFGAVAVLTNALALSHLPLSTSGGVQQLIAGTIPAAEDPATAAPAVAPTAEDTAAPAASTPAAKKIAAKKTTTARKA